MNDTFFIFCKSFFSITRNKVLSLRYTGHFNSPHYYCIDTCVNCFTFFLFFLDHSEGMDYCIDTGVNCFTFFSVFHLVQQSQQPRASEYFWLHFDCQKTHFCQLFLYREWHIFHFFNVIFFHHQKLEYFSSLHLQLQYFWQ